MLPLGYLRIAPIFFGAYPRKIVRHCVKVMVSFFGNLFLIMWRTQMKALTLILAVATTLSMAGAVNAADDMSMKKMTTQECTDAMTKCANDKDPAACKQALTTNNGCMDTSAPATAQ